MLVPTSFVQRLFTRAAIIASLALLAAPLARAQESFVSTHFGIIISDHVVPHNGGQELGVAIYRFDAGARTLEYRISISPVFGDSIASLAIYRAPEGLAGPKVFAIPLTPGVMTAAGTWTIANDTDLQALQRAQLYVQATFLHNTADAIRCQVLPIPNLMAGDMWSGEEVPPNSDSMASGSCSIWLDGANRFAAYHLEWDNLSGPPMSAHFHRGAKGVAAPPVHTITLPLPAAAKGTVDGIWENLTDDDITDLRAGRIYVNVHTDKHPSGEIRGQVYTFEMFTAAISPANETPPVEGSTMLGTGFAWLRGDGLLQSAFMLGGGTGLIGSAHIHRAPKGVPGPIAYELSGGLTAWGIITQDVMVADGDREIFEANGMYANFHTGAHATGEARGQLIASAGNISPIAAVPADVAAAGGFAAWYDRAGGSIRFRTDGAIAAERGSVVIYSSLGERVASTDAAHGRIVTADLASGVYVARLVIDGAPAATSRFVVAR